MARLFDPHNHLGGIVPYRVLAMASDRVGDLPDDRSGREIVDALLPKLEKDLQQELGWVPTPDDVEDFLAHHELRVRRGDEVAEVIKVKPPDSGWGTTAVFSTADAYTDGVANMLAESGALARLEIVVIARFYELVRDMLARAKERDWISPSRRARLEAGSGVLGRIVEASAGVPVPDWRALLDDPTALPGDGAGLAAIGKPMKRLLQNAFSATPLTDYDTAYVARKFLQDGALFAQGAPPVSSAALLGAALRELDRQGIGYAEVSAGSDEIKAMLGDPTCSGLLAGWADRVRIGWLAQVPNPLVMDPDKEADFGKVLAEVKPALADPAFAGFSVLAPETQEYGAHPETLRDRMGALLRALPDERRCVAHFHAGEGAPAWRVPGPDAVALLTGKRADIKPYVDPEATRKRAELANRNVTAVLNALEANKGLLRDSIRFRLGHVTHADAEQAKRMKALGVWADVNLTSNAATSAWFLDAATDVKRLTVDEYAAHGVTAVAGSGAKFVLGTDGSGVEHSTMMIEYELLRRLGAKQDPSGRWAVASARNGEAHMGWIGVLEATAAA
jgi:hypothetical protein